MAKTVYVLWAQYGDQSGEVFAGVYEKEEDAQAAKELVDKCQPSMQVKIEPVSFVPASTN